MKLAATKKNKKPTVTEIRGRDLLKRSAVTRVMVFGTFDILHPGHQHFFKQARRLAPNVFLIVSIARDANVQRIKGQFPRNAERQRARVVGASALVDKTVLGGVKNYLPHIAKEAPHVIALGYDQDAYVERLHKDIESGKLAATVVRLRPYKPEKYKTSILASKGEGYVRKRQTKD